MSTPTNVPVPAAATAHALSMPSGLVLQVQSEAGGPVEPLLPVADGDLERLLAEAVTTHQLIGHGALVAGEAQAEDAEALVAALAELTVLRRELRMPVPRDSFTLPRRPLAEHHHDLGRFHVQPTESDTPATSSSCTRCRRE